MIIFDLRKYKSSDLIEMPDDDGRPSLYFNHQTLRAFNLPPPPPVPRVDSPTVTITISHTDNTFAHRYHQPPHSQTLHPQSPSPSHSNYHSYWLLHIFLFFFFFFDSNFLKFLNNLRTDMIYIVIILLKIIYMNSQKKLNLIVTNNKNL